VTYESAFQRQTDLRKLQNRPPTRRDSRDLHESETQAEARLIGPFGHRLFGATMPRIAGIDIPDKKKVKIRMNPSMSSGGNGSSNQPMSYSANICAVRNAHL